MTIATRAQTASDKTLEDGMSSKCVLVASTFKGIAKSFTKRNQGPNHNYCFINNKRQSRLS